ncbi:MAG: hypothetical protein Q7U05_00415 [Polaromonas sp.]|nr:hypothetical protein [Polaromonas sp.]
MKNVNEKTIQPTVAKSTQINLGLSFKPKRPCLATLLCVFRKGKENATDGEFSLSGKILVTEKKRRCSIARQSRFADGLKAGETSHRTRYAPTGKR